MDRNAGVLVGIGPPLCCHDVLLAPQGLARVNHAVLEDYCRVSKYEIDRAVDVAFLVELPLRVDEERVLVTLEAAAVENGVIGTRSEGYGLVVLWSGRVAERYVAGYECFTGDPCKEKNIGNN